MKSVLALTLTACLVGSPLPVAAGQQAEGIRVRNNLAKLPLGRDTQLAVTLVDGITVNGYLSAVRDDAFLVTEVRVGTSTVVAYDTVRRVQSTSSPQDADPHGRVKDVVIVAAIIAGIMIGLIRLSIPR